MVTRISVGLQGRAAVLRGHRPRPTDPRWQSRPGLVVTTRDSECPVPLQAPAGPAWPTPGCRTNAGPRNRPAPP
jgi:hypothetical protein